MNLPPGIPSNEWEQPPQCMPDEYKAECSVDAYWNYYEAEKHTVANANEEKITRQKLYEKSIIDRSISV